MVKRTAPVRVIWFCLLAACGALCQSDHPATGMLQGTGSNSPEVQRPELRTWKSLPDAPSVQALIHAEQFHTFVSEARSPSTFGTVVVNARLVRETKLGQVTRGRQPATPPYKAVFTQKESRNFVSKYLYPSLLKQNLRYHPSTSSSLMGRAAYAASRIFITRDDFGKGRLNASYFFGVLSSVAARNASRPYWMRSNRAPFNDIGSMIGNDARINLFHEFGPGIRQIVKGHTPKIVFRIEERIIPDQHLRQVASSPAR
jgi:hypothetical protein